MIAAPHNDHACLGAITDEVAAEVAERDPRLVGIADRFASTEELAAWIRSLPQRDDDGLPGDGPKVAACRPPQRLRVGAPDPNCVERAATFIGAAELIDPTPVYRLATVETPGGLHTFPTADGAPVILDPRQSRNALRGCLFRAGRARNAGPLALTPTEAVDWIALVALEPAERLPDGRERVRRGHRALRAVLVGRPLSVAEVADAVLVLALAARDADLFGPAGRRVVQTTARAIDRLDRLAASRSLTCARNAVPELRFGKYTLSPDVPLLGKLARVSGRIGGRVGLEALKVKLAGLGITPPVLATVEQELNREGLTLGALAAPPPMLGTLGALTPEALAGRWLADHV